MMYRQTASQHKILHYLFNILYVEYQLFANSSSFPSLSFAYGYANKA